MTVFNVLAVVVFVACSSGIGFLLGRYFKHAQERREATLEAEIIRRAQARSQETLETRKRLREKQREQNENIPDDWPANNVILLNDKPKENGPSSNLS